MDDKAFFLFGAGDWGRAVLQMLGKERVAGFIDNSREKWGTAIQGVPVFSLDEARGRIKDGAVVIVTAAGAAGQAMMGQLGQNGIPGIPMNTVLEKVARERIGKSRTNLEVYEKAIRWLRAHTVEGGGIINNTGLMKPYPEVTGYFIPTLIDWGYRNLAASFAGWLCSIQKEDGSWYDTEDAAPYVFDSAQILKGLIAAREIVPEADGAILRGCDWILSNVQEDGRLTTPTKDEWREDECSELIHLYCLSPLREAARIFGIPRYEEAAKRVLDYYKREHYEEIMEFGFLSHFYAYVMEALLDLGETEMAKEAMERVSSLQKPSGAVPAYAGVDWVCSTGLFQFALVWFKLGEMEKGKRAFEYACRLQNESGGWYGSYLSEENAGEVNTYFPVKEISWAVKYFLDALSARNRAQFEQEADSFFSDIRAENGLYQTVAGVIREQKEAGAGPLAILDVGCGKGRYLNRLAEDFPGESYYAADLSERVMEYIANPEIEKRQGSLTHIPYADSRFDIVYTCEALEHAVDIRSSVREMARVSKSGGRMIIIDKNRDALGNLVIGEWEQWFSEEELGQIMGEYCEKVEVRHDLAYDGGDVKGLFSGWIGVVR